MILDEGEDFLFSNDGAVGKFGEEFFVEEFGRGVWVVDFFKDFVGDLANGHFEVADFIDDNIFGFVFFDAGRMAELGDHIEHDVHGGDAGFEIIIRGKIEDFVDEVVRDIIFLTCAQLGKDEFNDFEFGLRQGYKYLPFVFVLDFLHALFEEETLFGLAGGSLRNLDLLEFIFFLILVHVQQVGVIFVDRQLDV